MRHADASFESISDFERPLSLEGIEEVNQVSKKLCKKTKEIDHCICSTSKRTMETYCVLSKFIKIKSTSIEKEIYETDYKTLLKHINQINDHLNSAIIIAHNPSVSDFIKKITGHNIYLNTSEVIEIDFHVSSWNLVFLETGFVCNTFKPNNDCI